MKIHVSLYPVEIEKFFRLVLFNYIFSNGDAHVKNFSLIQIETGDYVLTPAYDLLCTRIHSPSESDMALMLLTDRFTNAYEALGFYTYDDFLQFGKALGIKESRIVKTIAEFNGKEERIDYLVDNSYLNEPVKAQYKTYYKDKIKRINMEWPRK